MSKTNFTTCLGYVLVDEGGNDDDPQDHGGRTSRGITQREYNAWRAEKGLSPKDVWTAPQSDVSTIYHDEYWEPYCDSMPLGVDYIYFNNAVLDGPYRAMVLLQQALGVQADGRCGPITRTAIVNANGPSLVNKLSDASANYYRGLHQPRFLKGWLNRVAFVEKNALAMINKGT